MQEPSEALLVETLAVTLIFHFSLFTFHFSLSFPFLLQFERDAKSGPQFQYRSDGQAHHPLVANGKAKVEGLHAHAAGGQQERYHSKQLLSAQTADDEIIPIVSLKHLHASEGQNTCGEDTESSQGEEHI